ncbi:tudor domain containing 9 protein spindle E isoform X2 [Leptinotarsa decemlineata]|uniref:tudor domain containing 9 protein spindle E isoform X2 n=1 Tax=Leptinotarsa decemlineata TaxID=7539 RepID=UPI003D3061BD
MNSLLAKLGKKITYPTGTVNGVMGVDDEEFSSTDEDELEPSDTYEQEFVMQEMNRYATSSTDPRTTEAGGMSDVESVNGIEHKNHPLSIYSSYNFNSTFIKKELPIDHLRDKIVNLVEVNNVVIIQGPTGCGKSTQVPQFILDHCREKSEYCNIAVTQPRKIATINVAKRVCEERGWTLGTVCGYQVGLEKKISPDMILTYMTTGVLLQKLIHAQSLHHYTHIIIDEVHERNQDLDFLMLIVRRFLFTNSPRTRVILMSATIEAEEFAYYFRCQNLNTSLPAPIIYVNKQNLFVKTTFYLENLSNAISAIRSEEPNFDIDRPEISQSIWKVFTFLVGILDKLDATDPNTNKKIIGSVLVFLPGIFEIEEADRLLKQHFEEDSQRMKWDIIPLHSSLPNDEQAKVFRPAKPGHRKVILSTNIAESSITVPDSYYVIDFCLTKVMTVDPITKYMSLKLEWASHVNCDQRSGRVGRIGNGRVYRLVPRKFYSNKMSEKSLPEILRAPLERIVLQAKLLNLNNTPQQILALALNPPNLRNIELTVLSLKESGGLLQTCKGKYSATDGDITFLGRVMALLPVDVRLSKLIVLGHLFSCLEETIIMAAGCSIQNIFSIPFQQRFNAYKKLLVWADGSFSDLIALLNLFQVWQSCKRENQFDNFQSEHRWCSMNLVSYRGLREWSLLVNEISQRLGQLNIAAMPNQVQLGPDERALVLKILAAGAFYPNFFIKTPESMQMEEREAVKMVGGRNPFRSVYFTGMDQTQPGPLYVRAIKDLLKNERESEKDISVGFDGSTKIYIEFKNFERRQEHVTFSVGQRTMVTGTVPGRIPNEVYEAIRKRQLKYQFNLNLLPLKEAWSWAERNGIKKKSVLEVIENRVASSVARERNCYTEDEYSPIPSLNTEWITIKITEHIDAGHFWVNLLESEIYLARIEEILNKTVLQEVATSGDRVKVGNLYATRYSEDNMFYRCQVISLSQDMAQVLFIDYGNIQQVALKALYSLPNIPGRKECDMAPLGVECLLHGVQPSRKVNPKGVWSEKINNHWKNQTMNVLLYAKVHSVVDNVLNVEVFKNQPQTRQVKSINQQMLELGHADPSIESFLSRADHEKRMAVLKSENPNIEAARLSVDRIVDYRDFDGPRARGANCKTIVLKGPFSPLEMSLYGCVESAKDKHVVVEGSSVNSVLLDSEPQDDHTRLLVAAYVSQSGESSKINLRQTTLMPNVPGLPTLLALLFCPTMKVKVTNDCTRVASVLCGLGCNQFTNKSFYPSHDLTLVCDTDLKEEEINKINTVRFHMNQGITLMEDICNGASAQAEMIRKQKALKKHLIDLVYCDRKPVRRTNPKNANVWETTNHDAIELKPDRTDSDEGIWPLLWFVRLKNFGDYNPNIGKNLEDLDLMAQTMIPSSETECLLCEAVLFDVHDVRSHLISPDHKRSVAEYYKKLQDVNLSEEED